MIITITKEEIINDNLDSDKFSVNSSIVKVSSPDKHYQYLIDKKNLSIFISGGKIGILNSEQIKSIKIKGRSFPIHLIMSDNDFFLILSVLEDELDDIHIYYKDISEEREKKLNQIISQI